MNRLSYLAPYGLQLKQVAGWLLPAAIYRPLSAWRQRFSAPHWGNMRRLTPVSRKFGYDRGFCIDRYYIEAFLRENSHHIQGRVLEVANSAYTTKFGDSRVTQADVLHLEPGHPHTTLVGNLTTGENIPTAAFDCIILTQTYSFIYDVQAAVENSLAALKPGGALLATFPGISPISRYDMERWGDYWRFTDASARALFGSVFGDDNITINTCGNVLAACAFLHGLASHELTPSELEYHDPDYQLVITVKAVRKAGHASL